MKTNTITRSGDSAEHRQFQNSSGALPSRRYTAHPLLLLLLLCQMALPARGATDVQGTIVYETWTKTGSPYNVVGDIFIAEVTIEAGVTVNFRGDYNFEVAGIITANGTSSEPVVFCGTNGWQGILFNEAVDGSVLTYCVISNSVNSGVRLVKSSLVLRDCTIAYNTAAHGGGINAVLTTNNLLTLERCTIRNNTANPSGSGGTHAGGGIYVEGDSLLKNCTVRDNVCNAAAGSFQDFTAYGGGLHSEVGQATIRNSVFANNQAVCRAGGYYNTCRAYGGGVCIYSGTVWMTNSILGSNVVSSSTSTTAGAGVFISSSATGAVVNCTLAYNNVEGLYSGNEAVPVLNSILYFNAANGTQLSGTTNVTYCDVQNGLPGVGNTNVNPIFLNYANLMIVNGSPCMDSGNPSAAYNDTCSPPSLGTARNDIGAHGGPGACSWNGPFTNPRDPANTNVSGTVVNETWTRASSPYNVVGDVLVAGLSIQPGVIVNFRGDYNFEVAGTITANGTSSEPVVFCGTNGWQGILFNEAVGGSVLTHCVISNSVNSGVRLVKSSPVLRDCTIAYNTAVHGGGINAVLTTKNLLTLERCTIRNNTANPSGSGGTHAGGGIYVEGDSLLKNCTVRDNVCNAAAGSFQDFTAYGGGLHSEVGQATIRNSVFANNQAVCRAGGYYNTCRAYGGGVCIYSGTVWMTNSILGSNVVSSSTSTTAGAGVFISSSATGAVVNCTLAYNNVEGLYSGNEAVPVLNSILYFNAANGTQLFGTTNVTYCDVQNGLPGVGNTNVNPIFRGTTTTNLIIVPPSRCIDGGNPDPAYNDKYFPPSLGGVRNDIGAHGGLGAGNWNPSWPPTILAAPTNEIVIVGSSAVLSVTASGTLPLSYQWRFNNASLSNETNQTLSLVDIQTNQAGNYDVVVTNIAGAVTSKPPAVLMVAIPVSINALTMQPASPVDKGTNVTFCVTAAGTPPLVYQWRYNGTPIALATSPCFTLTNVQVSQAGEYSVVVSNLVGSVTNSLALAVVDRDWLTNVVGATGDGSYSLVNGIFTVNGSGEDIEGTKDDFFFVHKPLVGDGQIVARMLGMVPADPRSEAGIMLRDGTNSGARHVFLALDSGRHVLLRRRLVTNDYSIDALVHGTNWTWLRLMRTGSTFAGHASTNGVDWSLVWWTTLVNMPTNLEAGLAVTAHKNQATATAQFDNVTPGPLTPLSGVWPEVGPRIYIGGEAGGQAEFRRVGGFKALIGGAVGDRYTVKWSANVQTPLAAWSPLVTVTNQWGVVEFLDAQALANRDRFYRVQRISP